MEHALVLSGAVLRYADFEGAAPTLSPNKGAWLPVAVSADPAFDPLTQALSAAVETAQAGQVVRARSVVAKPLATVKAEHKARAEVAFALRFTAGFTPATGPLAGKALQVRNVEDRTNWLTSQAAYAAAVAGGAGAMSGATFRTADNENVTVTYAEGLTALLDMAAWGKDGYLNLWALKDQIDAAQSAAAVVAIDVTAGW